MMLISDYPIDICICAPLTGCYICISQKFKPILPYQTSYKHIQRGLVIFSQIIARVANNVQAGNQWLIDKL